MSTEHTEFMMTKGDELTLRKILKEELENLPCRTMQSRVDKIEQKIKNGDEFEDKLTKRKEIGMTRLQVVLQTLVIVIGSPAMMLAVLKILKVI